MKKIIALIFLYAFHMYGSDAANLSSSRWQTTSSDISLQIIKHAKHPTTMYKTLRVLSKQSRAACSQESFIDNMMMYMTSTKKKNDVLLAIQIATPEMVSYIHRKIDSASDEEKQNYKEILRECEKRLAQGLCIGYEWPSRLNRRGLYIRQLVVASSIVDKNVYKNALIKHVLARDADSFDDYLALGVHVDPDYEKQFGSAQPILNELLYCCIRNLAYDFKDFRNQFSCYPCYPMYNKNTVMYKYKSSNPICHLIRHLIAAGAKPTKFHRGLLRSWFNDEGRVGKELYLLERLYTRKALLVHKTVPCELDMPHIDDETKFKMCFKKIYPDIKE